MSRRLELLRRLADGREHSGEALAVALEVSRAAVWKQVRRLEDWGLEIEAVPGRGYRLTRPVSLLDDLALREALPAAAAARLRTLTVAAELASTNDALLAVNDLPPGRFDACLAEYQSRGRGRRGREWVAPFGCGLCLSVNWSFAEVPPRVSALSLAIGVGIVRALAACDVTGVRLKWPNDVLHGGRKLGGILLELRAEAAGPAYVVVGVGLNVSLPPAARAAIGQGGLEPVGLDQLGLASMPARTQLAARLIGQLVRALGEFGQRGFAPFAREWRAADALAAQPARVLHGEQSIEGIARGIDDDGAFVLEVAGRRQRFVSGEVSLRPVSRDHAGGTA